MRPIVHIYTVMRKAERTKQFIIEKSAPVFNTKGIAGTSMNDIMEATQLAKGGVYRHFASKEALSLEVFNYLSNLMHDGVTGAVREIPTAKGKLYGLLDFYDNRILSKWGGCAILNFGAEADDTNPVMKEKVRAAIHRFKNRISKIIIDGQENGEFSKDFDAENYAIKVFTMYEGGVLISKIENNPEYLHHIIAMLKKEIEPHIL